MHRRAAGEEPGMGVALLVVDMQREIVGGLPPERRTAFVASLCGLIDRARGRGVPVVYVRHADAHLVAGTDAWQIVSELTPRPDEPVVDKGRWDSFRDTELVDVLGRLGTDDVSGRRLDGRADPRAREPDRGRRRRGGQAGCRGVRGDDRLARRAPAS